MKWIGYSAGFFILVAFTNVNARWIPRKNKSSNSTSGVLFPWMRKGMQEVKTTPEHKKSTVDKERGITTTFEYDPDLDTSSATLTKYNLEVRGFRHGVLERLVIGSSLQSEKRFRNVYMDTGRNKGKISLARKDFYGNGDQFFLKAPSSNKKFTMIRMPGKPDIVGLWLNGGYQLFRKTTTGWKRLFDAKRKTLEDSRGNASAVSMVSGEVAHGPDVQDWKSLEQQLMVKMLSSDGAWIEFNQKDPLSKELDHIYAAFNGLIPALSRE